MRTSGCKTSTCAFALAYHTVRETSSLIGQLSLVSTHVRDLSHTLAPWLPGLLHIHHNLIISTTHSCNRALTFSRAADSRQAIDCDHTCACSTNRNTNTRVAPSNGQTLIQLKPSSSETCFPLEMQAARSWRTAKSGQVGSAKGAVILEIIGATWMASLKN